jgi:hypothetical protein
MKYATTGKFTFQFPTISNTNTDVLLTRGGNDTVAALEYNTEIFYINRCL